MGLDQAILKPGEWALSYDVTDPGVLIYLTKGKELVKGLFKPIPRKEIDDLVRKFRESVEPAAGESIERKLLAFDFVSGKKLSEALVKDILGDLPQDAPVIVIPDDSLGVVPFEMLVLNEGGKIATDKRLSYITGVEFFGDRNPISYYQSVTALTLARTLQKKGKLADRLLVMAVRFSN